MSKSRNRKTCCGETLFKSSTIFIATFLIYFMIIYSFNYIIDNKCTPIVPTIHHANIVRTTESKTLVEFISCRHPTMNIDYYWNDTNNCKLIYRWIEGNDILSRKGNSEHLDIYESFEYYCENENTVYVNPRYALDPTVSKLLNPDSEKLFSWGVLLTLLLALYMSISYCKSQKKRKKK